eukprot:COSAG01_NODE_31042_length_604_cov_27.580198_1_plen_52_part_10
MDSLAESASVGRYGVRRGQDAGQVCHVRKHFVISVVYPVGGQQGPTMGGKAA